MISKQHNPIKGRLVSVDALRGFTMFWIIGGAILLRTLAHVWPNYFTKTIGLQMSHLNYGGFHFYDLIFPMFLFIVGVVLPFSVSRRLFERQNRMQIYIHAAKRAVLLILLGLITDADLLTFDLSKMYWWSALSLIGVAYFVAAVILLNTKAQTQALIVIILLLGYWAVRAFIGIKIPENYSTLPPAWSWYLAFSSAGAANVLIGVLAGHWLRSARPSALWKSSGLAIAGVISLIMGYAWGLFFPIIRFLWASSYVLVACGYSLLLLAIFYWIIEVKQYKKWAFFFVVIGMNPLLIYMLQRFVDFNEITRFFLQGIVNLAGTTGPIIMACGVIAVKWLLLWFLYRHKIFFKV